MRINKVMAIFWKEYDDVLKSKYILLTLIFMPLFLIIIIPFFTYLPIMIDPEGVTSEDLSFFLQYPLTNDWEQLEPVGQFFIIFVEFNWLYYLLIPIILPSIIAADSFTGEKDRGTVEGLVAAPLTETELYMGKITTAFFPTVLAVWIYSIPYIIMTNIFSMRVLGYYYLPNLRFFILIILIVPLATLISINIMIWASTKTSTTRDAQQFGSLILLPLMIIMLNIVVFAVIISEIYLLLGSAIMLILTILATKLGISLLDRERWLSNTA